MSFGDRFGIAGVILALFALAASYLWPGKRWIGWISLCFAIVLLFGWGWLEFGRDLPILRTRHPLLSTITVFIVGGSLAVGLWRLIPSPVLSLAPSVPAESESLKQVPRNELPSPSAADIAKEVAKLIPQSAPRVKKESQIQLQESIKSEDHLSTNFASLQIAPATDKLTIVFNSNSQTNYWAASDPQCIDLPGFKVCLHKNGEVDAVISTKALGSDVPAGPLIDIGRSKINFISPELDFNSNTRAIEVVNKQLEVILQISVDASGRVIINSRAYDFRGTSAEPLKRIFQYPSSKYPGTYASD